LKERGQGGKEVLGCKAHKKKRLREHMIGRLFHAIREGVTQKKKMKGNGKDVINIRNKATANPSNATITEA